MAELLLSRPVYEPTYLEPSGADLETNEPIKNYNAKTLGNPDLPIYPFKQEIVDTIINNTFTVLRSPTGNGKSTQVPQYLLEAGIPKVIITQPRIIAARNLAYRIREELRPIYGDYADEMVGYTTANESDNHPNNVIEIVTDGLQANREIHGNGIKQGEVLIVDEAHERNIYMSALLAMSKKNRTKTVMMSATINTENNAEYLCGLDGAPAPVIDMPGRAFPIEEKTGDSFVDEVVRYANDNNTVLAFIPMYDSISHVASILSRILKKDVPIIQLYGEQSMSEHAKAFIEYENGAVILATDIAKTSITIPGADVVVDCGWQRSGETRQDVDLLDIQPATLSTREQRKGRIGRVKPGIYVLAPLDFYPPLPDDNELLEYDIPEICKIRLDSIMLKMIGSAAIQFDDLDFMHNPEEWRKDYAVQRLKKLGAIAITGEVTEVGKEMAKLPVDSNYARMIVESYKYSERIQVMLLAAIAAHMNTTITKTTADAAYTYGQLTNEQNSEILVMLDVFIEAQKMTNKEREKFAIVNKKYRQAIRVFNGLKERLQIEDVPLEEPSEEDKNLLLSCIISGSDELYIPVNRYKHLDPRGYMRQINKNCPLRGIKTTVVGNALDIASITNGGKSYKNLIQGATRVSTEQLLDAAPHRCSFEPLEYVFSNNGEVLLKKEILFDGLSTKDFVLSRADVDDEMVDSITIAIMYEKLPVLETPNISNIRLTIVNLYDLQNRTKTDLCIDEVLDDIHSRIKNAFDDQSSNLLHIDRRLPLITVADYIDYKTIESIIISTPDSYMYEDTKIPIYYKDGKAHITLPVYVPIESVKELTTLDEDIIFVRFRNDGYKYRPYAEAKERFERQPRNVRRKPNNANPMQTTKITPAPLKKRAAYEPAPISNAHINLVNKSYAPQYSSSNKR